MLPKHHLPAQHRPGRLQTVLVHKGHSGFRLMLGYDAQGDNVFCDELLFGAVNHPHQPLFQSPADLPLKALFQQQ